MKWLYCQGMRRLSYHCQVSKMTYWYWWKIYINSALVFREDYHAKKAEDRKQFKAEAKAKAKQWAHYWPFNHVFFFLPEGYFYGKANCSKLHLFYSDKDEKQKQAEEEEMVRSLEVLSHILIEICFERVVFIMAKHFESSSTTTNSSHFPLVCFYWTGPYLYFSSQNREG